MKKMTKIILILLVFIQYLGVGFYAHIIILILLLGWIIKSRTPIVFNYADLLFFLFLGIIFIIKCMTMSLLDNILLFKFYWGFVLFYIFFKYTSFELDYHLLFYLVCGVTALDFILINTIIPIGIMKNVPGGELNTSAAEMIGGLYRCYGLGSSPTVSATIVVVLLSCVFYKQRDLYKDKYILYAIFPLLFLGSGTGFFLFFLFLFFRFKLYDGWKLIAGLSFVIILLSLMVYLIDNDNPGMFSRLSFVYFDYLISFKLEQIKLVNNLLNSSILEFLFGYSNNSNQGLRIMSDFGWLDMLESYGYFGVILLWIFIVIKRKISNIEVLLFLIGAFHYPGLFSIPGQMIFSSLLVSNKKIK